MEIALVGDGAMQAETRQIDFLAAVAINDCENFLLDKIKILVKIMASIAETRLQAVIMQGKAYVSTDPGGVLYSWFIHFPEVHTMNKYLYIAALFLSFSISGCATKTAPQATTTLPVTEKFTAIAAETGSQPQEATPAIEASAITERGAKSLDEASIAMEPVYFDFDSSLLSETSRVSLVNTSQVFLQNRALKVIVAGHCDDRGSEMYNIALGEKRALAVKNYLATLGVEPDRLEVVSYGEEKPAASGFDENSRALNRRVELM